VFKTIIVKSFHEALDVMFATARYRIGCKAFVIYSRKYSSFMVSTSFIGAPSAGEKRGCTKRKRIVSELSARTK
jgi:hypothetical protein